MRLAARSTSLTLLVLALGARAQAPLDPTLAARAFQEARWASDDDGAQLWGRLLFGPVLLVDPASRAVTANQADAEGRLVARDGVWVGQLPPEVGVANTAATWAGVRWTMVMWPLPEAPAVRTQLLLHECFHRVQAEVGLPPPTSPPGNAHLDTPAGRIWLRLEWRALAAALVGLGEERPRAARDALLFRARRRALFPAAAAEEDRLEVHEGLAEYTGVRLMGLGPWGRAAYLAGRMKVAARDRPQFPQAFAYVTGPALGVLLDELAPAWRVGLGPGDSLSQRLAGAVGFRPPADLAAEARRRAALYGGPQLEAEEAARERERRAAEDGYRARLVTGPTLRVPLPEGHYTYDPNQVFPLGEAGVVFPTTQLSDAWGVLVVGGGARLDPARVSGFVSAPAGPLVRKTADWELTLKPGWGLVPGPRRGDWVVAPSP
jgi:hypothetical protein